MVFKFSQIAEILHFSWVDIFFRDCTIFDLSFQLILSSSRPWKVSELIRDNWPDAATDTNEHIRIATLAQRTTPKQQHWIYEHEIAYMLLLSSADSRSLCVLSFQQTRLWNSMSSLAIIPLLDKHDISVTRTSLKLDGKEMTSYVKLVRRKVT